MTGKGTGSFLFFLLFSSIVFAQPNELPAIPVLEDTIVLKIHGDAAGAFLKAIEKGKIKATDSFSGEPIPATAVYTWRMPVDTLLRQDNSGNGSHYEVVQQYRSPLSVTRLRIAQGWMLDPGTGKLSSFVRWIELVEEIHTPTGDFIVFRPFCRICY